MAPRKPPAKIRTLTGTNKNVKKEEEEADRLVSSIAGQEAFDLELSQDYLPETRKEFTQLYEALNSIHILAKTDRIVFMQAAETFDLLLQLKAEYNASEELPERLLLIDKMDRLRKTLYTLLSKYFTTPEDRFKAALAVAHGDKKKTAVSRMINDDE